MQAATIWVGVRGWVVSPLDPPLQALNWDSEDHSCDIISARKLDSANNREVSMQPAGSLLPCHFTSGPGAQI